MSEKQLTAKQRRFAALFTGNVLETLRLMRAEGISISDKSGDRFIKMPHVIKAIRQRDNGRLRKHIMTRAERQEFWTSIVQDENAPLKERIRASEILGRSEADFCDKLKVDHELAISELLDDVPSNEQDE